MTFWEFVWAMIVFYFMFMVIWMFISVFADIFRREDLSGWSKTFWILLLIFLPFLGILIYMISRPKMTEQDQRMIADMQEKQRRMQGYSAADEIAKAQALKDSGAISDVEFEQMKKRALS